MTKEYDKAVKEAGVKFLPFVGDDYEKGISFDKECNLMLGTTDEPGKKVLVLGESHYCDEELSDEEMSSFTRDVVDWYLNARKSSDAALWMKTFLKFERALANKVTEPKDSANIWNHLMFYNYLQVPLEGARMAGRQEDYENAREPFFKLLEVYRPDYIIVWGYRLYDRLPNDNGKQGKFLSSDLETWQYDFPGYQVKVLPTYHPSAGFSWEVWHDNIVVFLKEC